jgi:hypothetical protein
VKELTCFTDHESNSVCQLLKPSSSSSPGTGKMWQSIKVADLILMLYGTDGLWFVVKTNIDLDALWHRWSVVCGKNE